jgi:hypothetical protein
LDWRCLKATAFLTTTSAYRFSGPWQTSPRFKQRLRRFLRPRKEEQAQEQEPNNCWDNNIIGHQVDELQVDSSNGTLGSDSCGDVLDD